MARPLKDGIDYFPMDVGFLQDKKVKLIKGEFGSKGVVITIHLLCQIYGENGYFLKVDEEDYILLAEDIGCDVTPGLIEEVVQGLVKRSFFDEGVFNRFSALTSRGIQRRYLRAVSTRDFIEIFEEYWLLNIRDKKDVPASISKKITFKKVSLQRNPDKTQINAVNLQINPQSKVKERKEKKSKEEGPSGDVFSTFEQCGFQITSRAVDELNSLSEEYSSQWVIEAIKRSADRGKKSISYIKGILNNWSIAGAIDDSKKPNKETSHEGREVDDFEIPY